ncbi:cobalamin biosynthesis protein [Peptostreptococcaceae bacterium AGR-M142]
MNTENKDKIENKKESNEFRKINKKLKSNKTIVYGLTLNSLKLSLKLARHIENIKIYMPKRLEKKFLKILETDYIFKEKKEFFESEEFLFKDNIVLKNKYISIEEIKSKYIFYENRFKDNIALNFKKDNKLVFIMALGIVVRTIKDYIEDKFNDPAVIVCDELGINTISVLSGHVGNANKFSIYISKILNSNPIITTSTDINNKASLDLILKKINGVICGYSLLESKVRNKLDSLNCDAKELEIANENNQAKLLLAKKYFKSRIKYINRLLVENQKILILFDLKKEIDLKYYKKEENDNLFGIKNIKRQMKYLNLEEFDLIGTSYIINSKLDKDILKTYKHIILITNKKESKVEKFIKQLIDLSDDLYTKIITKNLVLSIGCKKNKTKTEIKKAFYKFLEEKNIDKNAILKIATVDVKEEEQGLIEFARDCYDQELNIIKRDEIKLYEDLFDKSEFVKKSIGVYSVSEPVAYIVGNNNLVVKKSKYNGITFSVSNANME